VCNKTQCQCLTATDGEKKGGDRKGEEIGRRRDLPDRCQTISYAPELGADAIENTALRSSSM